MFRLYKIYYLFQNRAFYAFCNSISTMSNWSIHHSTHGQYGFELSCADLCRSYKLYYNGLHPMKAHSNIGAYAQKAILKVVILRGSPKIIKSWLNSDEMYDRISYATFIKQSIGINAKIYVTILRIKDCFIHIFGVLCGLDSAMKNSKLIPKMIFNRNRME